MQTAVVRGRPARAVQQHSARRQTVVHSVAHPVSDVGTPSPSGAQHHPVCGKALKEWAVAVAALGNGEQTVLFRKGGIKEPTFKPESKEFILFPTGFHTDVQLLKPGVSERYQQEMAFDPKALIGSSNSLSLPYYAQVTGAWTTFDTSVFGAVDAFHVWNENFVDTRLKWRPKQPATILELRCWRLAQPLVIPVTEQLFGCFSFVDLTSELPAGVTLEKAGAQPVLPDSVFAEKQKQLRQVLSMLDVQPLAL